MLSFKAYLFDFQNLLVYSVCLVHVDSLLKSNNYADKLRNDIVNSIRQKSVLPKHTRKPARKQSWGKVLPGDFVYFKIS